MRSPAAQRRRGAGHDRPLRAAAVVACAIVLAAGTAHASPSQRTLQARAYEHGQGVERNQERAARLYCEAARDGDADAAFALGWMFTMGRGIARDDARFAAPAGKPGLR